MSQHIFVAGSTVLSTQAETKQRDHHIGIMQVTKFLLNLLNFLHERNNGLRQSLCKYFKRVAQTFCRNTQIMQFSHVVGIIDVLIPIIEFIEPRLCNNTSVVTCRCLRVQSRNWSSFYHDCFPLQAATRSAAPVCHHPQSVKKLLASPDALGDRRSGEQSATECRVVIPPAPAQVAAANWPP